MTIRPPGLHPYRRSRRQLGPRSVAGLKGWWPISGPFYQDAAMTTVADFADPVGAREDVSGQASHLTQSTTSKKPTLNATGPGVDYDMVDDLLRANYSLSMASKWAIAMAVWSRDDTDKFVLTAQTVANQTSEYYVEVEAGDVLTKTMPSNWDPNSFVILIWGRPSWAYDDGATNYFFDIDGPGNDRIRLLHESGNPLSFEITDGTTTKSAKLTQAFSAGDEIFAACQYDGANLTIHVDDDADNILEATATAKGALTALTDGTWTFHVGGDSTTAANDFSGGLNIAILDDGSSATPVTDRFGSGSGQAILTWLETYGENLVAYLPKSKDGVEVQFLNFQAPSLLRLPGGAGDYASTPDSAALSVTGDIDIQAYGTPDDWSDAASPALAGKYNTSTAQRSYALIALSSGKLGLNLSDDGTAVTSATSSVVHSLTDGSLQWVRATWRASDGRVQFFTGGSGATPSWVQLGSDQTIAIASIFDGTAVLTVGSLTAGAGNRLAGTVSRVRIFADLTETTAVFDADFTKVGPGRTTFLEDSSNAATVTINQSGTPQAEIIADVSDSSQKLGNTDFEADAANWTGSDASVAQSAAQAYQGGNSLLVTPSADDGLTYPDAVSITAGLWYYIRAHVYPVTSSAFLRNRGATFASISEEATSIAAWQRESAVREATSGGSVSPIEFGAGADQDTFHVDEAVLFEFDEPAWTTATKGVPSRVIWSFSKDAEVTPYVYAGVATDEKVEIGFKNDAAARAEASSSSGMATGAHSLIIEFDGTDIKAYLDTVEVASLTVTGVFTGLDEVNVGGLVGFLEGHPFDERIGEAWLHAGADFPGHTATDRKRLHNYLADRTVGLAVVA